MHVAFRDGYADRAYMEASPTTRPARNASCHRNPGMGGRESPASRSRKSRPSPLWSARRKRSFFRLGYGFTRSRNGAVSMHAALSIATVLGAWQYEGGGAFHSNSAIFHLRKRRVDGHEARRSVDIRMLDQSQIGRVLTGDAVALRGRGPVTAMLIQNTNPANVAPEQAW
jgi:hypothetical protein